MVKHGKTRAKLRLVSGRNRGSSRNCDVSNVSNVFNVSNIKLGNVSNRKAAWAANPGIAQLLSVDHWLLSMGFFSRFQDEKGVAKLKTQEIKRYTCRVYSYMV